MKHGFAARDGARIADLEWIGFDLDDTLHDFSGSSRTARDAVLRRIIESGAAHSIGDLQMQYADICAAAIPAFVDGRTATQYRTERWNALLRTCEYPAIRVADCVELYTAELAAALSLHSGVRDCLRELRARGLRIAVISEGPHDAQEWTLRQLGIADSIDRLITSNRERTSKKAGLFRRFGELVSVAPKRAVIVGDSIENDIEPALLVGMHAVHYRPVLGRPEPYMTARSASGDQPEVITNIGDLLPLLERMQTG